MVAFSFQCLLLSLAAVVQVVWSVPIPHPNQHENDTPPPYSLPPIPAGLGDLGSLDFNSADYKPMPVDPNHIHNGYHPSYAKPPPPSVDPEHIHNGYHPSYATPPPPPVDPKYTHNGPGYMPSYETPPPAPQDPPHPVVHSGKPGDEHSEDGESSPPPTSTKKSWFKGLMPSRTSKPKPTADSTSTSKPWPKNWLPPWTSKPKPAADPTSTSKSWKKYIPSWPSKPTPTPTPTKSWRDKWTPDKFQMQPPPPEH